MKVSKKEIQFDTKYFLYLLNRFWILILSVFILGGIVAFCFNEFSIPLYKAQISLFTWNRGIAEAIRKLEKNQKDKKNDEIQKIMMYNNIISQSIYVGQRLISDYESIMKSPRVKEKTNEDLIKQGFKTPLKYSFECIKKRQSCIMNIAVVSPDGKLAAAAANSLVKAFKDEQERLMDVKYAQAMYKAIPPKYPFSPRKGINLFLGFFLGLLIGLGIAFVLDYQDMTIKNPDDLKKLDLLALGIIPYHTDIDKLCGCGEDLKMTRRENSVLDAVRVISTTISFLRVDDPPKIIAFTSAMPGAGKSTQVLLLAKILGAGNKRVLIIDCDLRKPRIYKNIKLPNKDGLVNYLKDNNCNDPEKYINPDIFTGVDLMMHGLIPPNPTELLDSRRFADMLKKLREAYDCILLDSPPCFGMADAMVLGKSADAIIMMIETGKTRTHDIVRSMELFDSLSKKIIGAILNKVSSKRSNEYYYSYGYYEAEKSES